MAVIFNKVRWKNLLSTGESPIEIQLDTNINTLIVGENGSGKSTLIDALCFALFGKPYRKINKPQLVNSVNYRNTLAEVEFTIGTKKYLVRRGIKPTLFEIICNGVLLDQTAASRDYQAHLEKNILKLNFQSFTQIVTLGSSSFIPFMQLSAIARREIIENLLDIKIFTKMNILLKDRVADNKSKMQESTAELTLIEERLKLHQQHSAAMKQQLQQQINEHNREIDRTNVAIDQQTNLHDQNSKKIIHLQKANINTDKLRLTQRSYIDLRSQLQIKVVSDKKSIVFLESNDNCPICLQNIDEDVKQMNITQNKDKIKEISAALVNIDKKLTTFDKQLGEIAGIQVQIKLLQQLETDVQNKIKTHSESIDRSQFLINNLQEQIDSQDNNKESEQEIGGQLKRNKKVREKLINIADTLGLAGELLKDRGIKTQIIKQYVPIMNQLINNYLKSMNFFIDFALDDAFNETIRSRHRDDFSYASFSEGEKQRIDLALLFTWRTVAKLKNSMSTNLLILDETFDSSLDEIGCEDFLKLIFELGTDTNVFVISHKGDILADKFRSTIRFEKVKGFTQIAK